MLLPKPLFKLSTPDRQNKTAPGGDTGAASRARRLLSAAEWHLVRGVDQPITAFVERVGEQMRMP